MVGVKFDTKLFGLKDPATGNVEGFDIDMSKEIAKHILGDENALELKEVTSKTRIPMLNNGEIDMIVATMTITEERKKEVDFSDVYFQAGQSLLVKKGSPIKGIEDVTAAYDRAGHERLHLGKKYPGQSTGRQSAGVRQLSGRVQRA